MSWSVNISGHGDSPAGANCYYSHADGSPPKQASFSGSVHEIAGKSAAFIEHCRAAELAKAHEDHAAEGHHPPEAH